MCVSVCLCELVSKQTDELLQLLHAEEPIILFERQETIESRIIINVLLRVVREETRKLKGRPKKSIEQDIEERLLASERAKDKVRPRE